MTKLQEEYPDLTFNIDTEFSHEELRSHKVLKLDDGYVIARWDVEIEQDSFAVGSFIFHTELYSFIEDTIDRYLSGKP